MQKKIIQIVVSFLILIGLVGLVKAPFQGGRQVNVSGMDVTDPLHVLFKTFNLPFDPHTFSCILAIIAAIILAWIAMAAIKTIF